MDNEKDEISPEALKKLFDKLKMPRRVFLSSGMIKCPEFFVDALWMPRDEYNLKYWDDEALKEEFHKARRLLDLAEEEEKDEDGSEEISES
jgi:hypothetical protein